MGEPTWPKWEPTDAWVALGPLVTYEWVTPAHWFHRDHGGPCERDIRHLLVWHDCALILGPDSVAPGARYGWAPAGVGEHTLVQAEPLTITASVYWPRCCGLHGWITDGAWVGV